MISSFSLASFLIHALSIVQGASTAELGTAKSVLTTVLLAVAVAQVVEQALLYKWIRVRNLNRPLVVRLHRMGGLLAVVLIFIVLILCWYTWLGLGYPLNTLRVVAHAVLGGLATGILLTKVAIANRFRQLMGVTLPLGISVATFLLGNFLIAALPHFLGWV